MSDGLSKMTGEAAQAGGDMLMKIFEGIAERVSMGVQMAATGLANASTRVTAAVSSPMRDGMNLASGGGAPVASEGRGKGLEIAVESPNVPQMHVEAPKLSAQSLAEVREIGSKLAKSYASTTEINPVDFGNLQPIAGLPSQGVSQGAGMQV